MSLEQNPSLSLFKLLRQKSDQRLPTVRCTKATLVHLSHTLEDTILSRRIPAMIFTGFQESAYWRQETERYQALAQVAQQVCIFAGAPLPPESEATSLHVPLNGNDPLRQEWFLAILSEPFAVILCGQDCQIDTSAEATRQFDTLWSFDPQSVNEALNLLVEVIAIYRPEQLPQLQAARTKYPIIKPDLAIITNFTMQMICFEETLRQRYSQTEVALQQHQEHLEKQILERTIALTQANQQLQQEIIDRQQIEAALAEERNLLRTLIDNLPDLIYVKDTKSRFLLVNAAVLYFMQLKMDEIIGKTTSELHSPEVAAQYITDDQVVTLSGEALIGREEGQITPSGEQIWLLTSKVPLRDSQGQIIGLMGISRDITKRKQTEEELQRYRDHLEDLVIERTTELRAANQQLQREIAERKHAEAERAHLLAAEHEQRLLAETMREVTLALTSQTDHTTVLDEILRQAQRIVQYSTANITLLQDDLLRVAFWQGYEAFNSEEFVANLIQSLAEFPLERSVIQSQTPLVIHDTRQEPDWVLQEESAWIRSYLIVPICLQGRVLGLLRLGGDTLSQFSTQDAQRLQTLANAAAIALENVRLHAETQARLQEQMTLRQVGAAISSTLDLGTVLSLIAEQMGQIVDVTSVYILSYEPETTNVTVLAEYFGPQARPQERESDLGVTYNMREDFAEPIDFLQTGQPNFYQLDSPDLNEFQQGHMQRFGAQTVLAIPLRIGGQVTAFAELWESRRRREFTPDEIALCQGIAQQAAIAIKNAQLHQQTQKQARQMEQILHSITAGILLLDPEYRIKLVNKAGQDYLPLLATVEVGQILTHLGERPLVEMLVALPPGQWHEVTPARLSQPLFQVYARPVVAESAETEGWVMVLRDITEERDIQKRMQQQEKLVAVGQLAAGIAHDFNNILTSIIGFAELARWTPDLPMSVGEDLSRIIKQGQRAAHLVRQILDFARKNIVAKRPLELTRFLEEMVNLLERTIPENIQLDLKIEPNQKTYLLNADLTQLQQALTNLAVNAADAMPTGGILQFHLAQFTLAVGQRPPCPEMVPGDWLALSIVDTGVGMPLEVQLHLFEPFFTTKEVGQGTGLGLAQVEGIVKQHEGYIKVKSRVGQGTTFTLYFPPLPTLQPAASPEIAREERKLQGQGKVILLVEDNKFVREVVEAMLKGLGYQVLTAANGRSALEVYDLHRDSIALVITDLTMPEMGGFALAEALQAKNRAVKILAMTGYPLNMKPEDLTRGIAGWLQKPLSLEQLAQQLEQTLQN
jgi:PAS domain S-box-containing protein